MVTRRSKSDPRRRFVPSNSIDDIILQSDPNFIDYLFFHNVLDKLCWIVKLQYADRETVKSKNHRLDTLFQRFLLENSIRQDKAARCLSSNPNAEKLEFHLTKGWHNELIRNDPLQPEYLRIGTLLNEWAGPGSGGTATWNVIQSYYAAFEFYSCIAAAVQPTRHIIGHRQLARELNNNILGRVRDRVLFYPFSISSPRARASTPVRPFHSKFHYAAYPRDRDLSLVDLETQIFDAYELIGNGKPASLIDLLYQLRLWANYTGVASLLRLADGGFQQFLIKNLATIVFFAAGMAELSVIFSLGESTYLRNLKRFGSDYIDRNERFGRHKYLIPAYVRLRSFKHVGIIAGSIDFIIPSDIDPIQFVAR